MRNLNKVIIKKPPNRAIDYFKSPFPYPGGKSCAAIYVWKALGDVYNYIEPFFGSGSVLFRRKIFPDHNRKIELVNDKDMLLINAYRAIKYSPHETADSASWIANEADHIARQCALIKWVSDNDNDRLLGDPYFHDPLMAGWWIWGVGISVDMGFAKPFNNGPWFVNNEKKLVCANKDDKHELGIDPKYFSEIYQRYPGVCKKRIWLGGLGRGVFKPGIRGKYGALQKENLLKWFEALSKRLQYVQILNGDWSRVCCDTAINVLGIKGNKVGIFLDPPYSSDLRAGLLYASDLPNKFNQSSLRTLHSDIQDFCIQVGNIPYIRIVLAGFESEHNVLEDHGWKKIKWFKDGFLKGGFSKANLNGNRSTRQDQERLWLSPYCNAII